jgi:transcriptional regulator with GAF, ATPase, and Fis domain
MHKNEQIAPPLPEIIGTSTAMQSVYRRVRLVAPANATVLLVGETGTGKEVIAKAIHKLSGRADGPYIRVNCGALPETLLESELFGHVKGAFTGAIENKAGRFEAAHGGTIFLDEINSMSAKLQVKLLRVLQEREFERVGESRTIRVDVRVVAATNATLEDLVERNEFREDLYYRLNVVPVVLPPLRDRPDDIPLLVKFFLKRYADANKRAVPEVPAEVHAAVLLHDWPGNVRELENAVERLVVLSGDGPLAAEFLHTDRSRVGAKVRPASGPVVPADLPGIVRALVRAGMQHPLPAGKGLHEFVVGTVERELIEQAMRQCGNTQITAAKLLDINRNTLHKKLSEYESADAAPRGEPAT